MHKLNYIYISINKLRFHYLRLIYILYSLHPDSVVKQMWNKPLVLLAAKVILKKKNFNRMKIM